jgi:hypothetical protein
MKTLKSRKTIVSKYNLYITFRTHFISVHKDTIKAVSQASHRGGPASNAGQSIWDLWWTKWH